MSKLPSYSAFGEHFCLDREIVFLNHGSFGACPREVQVKQQAWRERLEREPIRFFVEDLEALLDGVRAELGRFLGADPEGLVRVTNATEGVNTVLRSLRFEPGDELLTNTHEYNACNNALRFVAERSGAKVVEASMPWPLESERQVVEAVLGAVTKRTRMVLLSHITSPTGVVFPVDAIVRELNGIGVDALVDGAHAPGMVPLSLNELNAPYYTGNCHKWMCAPKGAAFLWVRADRRELIRPLIISHGANTVRTDRPKFRIEFDYTGTADLSPYLVLPELITFMQSLMPGGWAEIMRRNREMAIAGRKMLCREMGTPPMAPESMIASLASVEIADRRPGDELKATRYHDSLQDRLIAKWRVQAPIVVFPSGSMRRLVRISPQVYNTMEQIEYLARALKTELA